MPRLLLSLMFLALAACLPSAVLSAAETPSLPAALRQAQAAAATIPALRMTFVQTKHLAILDEPLTTPGCLEMDRAAGALRWEFTGQAVLIFSKGHLRRWGPDGQEENLGGDPGGQAVAKQLQAMLTGDWTPLLSLFTIADGPDGTVVFTPLTPDIARFIVRLTLSFAAAGAPTGMLLETTGGDRTEYRFAPPDAGWKPDPARFLKP